MNAGPIISAWENTHVTGILTISPLHVGSGENGGAVDLPIARDVTSGFPVIPSTALKGVARETLELALGKDENSINRWFGQNIESENSTASAAGQICVGEARLIAYPARSLNRPFLHITCRLILERLRRDLRAFGIRSPLNDLTLPQVSLGSALVADSSFSGKTLVIEDFVIPRVAGDEQLRVISQYLSQLIPEEEEDTRCRLKDGLVLLADEDFQELIERCIPVRARIKLTDGKTTDKWVDSEGITQEGNLWYEEHLPSDCLFTCFVGGRRQYRYGSEGQRDPQNKDMMDFLKYRDRFSIVQIGGNETVGHGLCYWQFLMEEVSR